jgi:hypothetical protein
MLSILVGALAVEHKANSEAVQPNLPGFIGTD